MHVRNAVCNAIQDCVDHKEGKFSESANLRDDLGVDSLDIVEIVMQVEEELGIMIEDDQFSNLMTVGELMRVVEKATGYRKRGVSDTIEVLVVGHASLVAREASRRKIPFVFLREIRGKVNGLEGPTVHTVGKVNQVFRDDVEKWEKESCQTWAGIHIPGSLVQISNKPL